MNNKERYKNTFSQIRPSDKSVERVIDMTKNKKSRRIRFSPFIAAAACAAVIICSIIGGGAVSARINTVDPSTVTKSGTTGVLSKITDANVLIAYAGDESVKAKPLKLNVATPLKSNIIITDIKGKSEKEIEAIVEQNRNKVEADIENADTATWSIERLDNILFSCVIYDYFAIKVDDPNTIESIEMKCNTDYWKFTYQNSNEELSKRFTHGNDLKVDGEELVQIMNKYESDGYFKVDLDHDVAFCNAVDKNPDIDLSTFDDTLTFTINYKDGTKAQSVININYDKDGNFSATAVAVSKS